MAGEVNRVSVDKIRHRHDAIGVFTHPEYNKNVTAYHADLALVQVLALDLADFFF